MIPVTDLVYNYDYAKRLHRGNNSFEEEWERIVRIGGDFEKIYEEYIQQILESIEKYSGFPWEQYAEDFLTIYIVGSKPSFVHPLTVAVDEDPKVMLEDFIFQLAHRNMYFGFPSEELRQQCLQTVTDYVLYDLGQKEIVNPAIDLQYKPLKEYLNKNYGISKS